MGGIGRSPRVEPPIRVRHDSRARLKRARRDAERTANRIAILQAASAALEEAVTVPDVSAIIVQHGRAALGARHALLALLAEGHKELRIVRATGFEPHAFDNWTSIPLAAQFPLADAVRARAPIYLETAEELRAAYPSAPILEITGAQACAIVPLSSGERVLGVLGLCFAVARKFSDEERSLLSLLARQAGAALERAERYEAERLARAQAEVSKRRSEFLADASGALTMSLELTPTLENVARLAVPFLADACVIDMRDANGRITRAAAAHVDIAREAPLREALREQPIAPEGNHPIARVARTGTPVLVSGLEPAFSDERAPVDLASWYPIVSYIVVPLIARDRILGTIMLASENPARRYREADLALAGDLAHRAALAVDNARLYQDAQNAIRAREEVLAIVSHDLRNPLGVVRAMVGMLKRCLPDDESGTLAREHCQTIARAVLRMDRQIDDLMDVTSIDTGALAINLAPLEAAALVDEAVTMLRPLAAEKGLSILAELPPESFALRGDRVRLLQVFSNLVDNAMKFTPPGGKITIAFTPGRHNVTFSVEDTGPGIAPDHLPYIFERYWQHGGSDVRRGCGLGLAIVKGIIEAHGGRVSASSAPGHGARFVLEIPR
jgi:signal transduction histidine kinase